MDGFCPEGVGSPPSPGLAAFASSRTRLQRGFFTSAGHCSRTSAQEGWRLISDRLGNFEKVQDDKLMQNKENGTYRPTFFCMRDEKHPFFGWFQ